MKKYFVKLALISAIAVVGFGALLPGCGSRTEDEQIQTVITPEAVAEQKMSRPRDLPSPDFPDLQREIMSDENTRTSSPIGGYDFGSHTYPFPRGWQDKDAREFTIEEGTRPLTKEKIGIQLRTAKYGDVTGDGEDEAFVILKLVTGGSGLTQIVYVYSWDAEKSEPKLIWHFRTGDRADGGLKNVYADSGDIIVELFGQDRYILGEVETLRITGDEVQICCPSHFTRNRYKWNGRTFQMDGKRLTYPMDDEDAPPEENKGDAISEKKERGSKR